VTVAATGAFGTKDVGTDKTVALNSSYGGADESNYVITDQTATTADVQPIKMGNVLLDTIVTDVVNPPAQAITSQGVISGGVVSSKEFTSPTLATGDMTYENINSSEVDRSELGSSEAGASPTGLMTVFVVDGGISVLQAKDEENSNGE
jgi:hypothetical protein